MGTFYMVEMHYPLHDDREKFNDFYHKHITMLLSIDGFLTAQRYECTHEAVSPFLAVYKQRDAGVLTSDNYTSRAGRDSVDPVFKAKMTNWHRNLVEGDIEDMNLGENGWLVLIDRNADDAPALPKAFTPLQIIGLDETIKQRGVLIGQSDEPTKPADHDGWTVRTLRPIHPPRYPA